MCATVVLSVHHKHVRHCGPERPPLTYVPRHPAHGPRHVHHAPLHTAFDVLMGTPAVGEGKHGGAYRLMRELEFDCPVRSGRRSLTRTTHGCTSTPWVWGPQDTLGKGVGLWPEGKVYLIKVGSEVWAIGNT